jgi:hypothetical protein
VALTALREQLRRHPPPIDYQLRRIIADDPNRLVRAIHEAGLDTSNVDKHEVHNVVCRFWEHFTGGYLAYAPPPYALPPTEVEQWLLQTAAIDHNYANLFQDAYECMVQANSLTWSPVTTRKPWTSERQQASRLRSSWRPARRCLPWQPNARRAEGSRPQGDQYRASDI